MPAVLYVVSPEAGVDELPTLTTGDERDPSALPWDGTNDSDLLVAASLAALFWMLDRALLGLLFRLPILVENFG
jgi:hypothetical protein